MVPLYDKGGVGDSGGRYRDLNAENSVELLNELACDATRALLALSSRQGVDATQLGFIGGSQAGWVIPLAARLNDQARFMVVIPGPAVRVGLEMRHSTLTREGRRDIGAADLERGLAEFQGPHGYRLFRTCRV